MNRRLLLAAGSAAAALALAGCASPPTPADYAAERPLFELEKYFDGTVLAHGIFTDRSGKVLRRFTVTMKCSWNGDQGVLDEDFVYSDGKTEKRVWRITKTGPGRYVGRADDVVGEAVGQSAGNALNWRYTLRLPVDGKTYDVQFDDWMYRIDERVVLNKAVMSKFGVFLGEVTLAFRKP